MSEDARGEDAHAGRLLGEVETDNAVRVADVGGAADEQSIRDPEHRGVGADAEGKRDRDERRERGLSPEPTHHEADVAKERLHGDLPWVSGETGVRAQVGAERERRDNRVRDDPRGVTR